MKNIQTYEEVSRWIKSTINAESLKHIVQFIENAHHTKLDNQQKSVLLQEVQIREHELLHIPYFCPNSSVLLNKKGLPQHYSSKLQAAWKYAELTLKGYKVQIDGLPGLHTIKQIANN